MNTPKLDKAIEIYMPSRGEGETLASQCVTAVNKLVYKWWNDGDVYDNVHSGLQGWANDLSSYANWLFEHNIGADILYRIYRINTEREYEELLEDLCDNVLDEKDLEELNKQPTEGSIYKCAGPFEWSDEQEEEDDEEDDEW